MRRTKLMLVGGFLGAGKTTAIARLANHFSVEGMRVGVITNDQADDLVDTERLKAQGHRVEQVAGACFCCSFGGLMDRALALAPESDIIIAEPVGSCTDLSATVSAPILSYHGTELDLMPYSVLLDPVLAQELLVQRGTAGFPAEVAYIFRKQLEEADIICLNKTDQVIDSALAGLLAEIWTGFPQSYPFPISAITGQGFDHWITGLWQIRPKARITNVDYDTYADGEAALGWLNLSADISSEVPRIPNAYALTFMNNLVAQLETLHARIAHIKIMVSGGAGFALSHRTAGNTHTILSSSSSQSITTGKLLINARVVIDPESLTREVSRTLAESFGSTLRMDHVVSRSLRPGRPVPVHRFTAT